MLDLDADHFAGKLLELGELLRALAGVREAGGKVVFTNGCFDVVHAGHVRYLREAAGLGGGGDVLVVGLNGDAAVGMLKGAGRPIYGVADRAEILAAFSFVDFVVVFETESVLPLVEAVRPDVLVKGGDYGSDGEVVGGEFVKANGGVVVRVGELAGLSSTETLARLGGKKGE